DGLTGIEAEEAGATAGGEEAREQGAAGLGRCNGCSARSEHTGEVVTADPEVRVSHRRSLDPEREEEGSEEAGPMLAEEMLGPLPALWIDGLAFGRCAGGGARLRALPNHAIAGEARPHTAGASARAHTLGAEQGGEVVAVEVLDVRVHRVLERDFPVGL